MSDSEHRNHSPLAPKGFRVLRWRLLGLLLSALTVLLTGLHTIIAWLLAPLALVFDFVVLMPLGRFRLKFPAKAKCQTVERDDLPDAVWRYFLEASEQLAEFGFREGKCLHISGFPELDNFVLTMTHPAQGMGVGIMYSKVPGARDESADQTACEFTCALDGQLVDLTNSPETEPFHPLPIRKRLFLDGYEDRELFLIFKAFSDRSGCSLPPETLEQLENHPQRLLADEFDALMESHVRRGLMKKSKHGEMLTLTWKGAFVATTQIPWPMSTAYRRKLRRHAREFLAEYGVDPDEVTLANDDGKETLARLGQRVDDIQHAIDLSRPIATERRVAEPPVWVGIMLGRKDGRAVVESIDIAYQHRQDFPQRGLCLFRSFLVSLDNLQDEICFRNGFTGVVPISDVEDYGYENQPALPVPLKGLLDLPAILDRIEEASALPQDSSTSWYLLLQMDEDGPVWEVYGHQSVEDDDLRLDARTGERRLTGASRPA